MRAVFGENFDALLELDEIKKPSSPDKGGLDEQANTPAVDGYNKLIQKIKNASAKIKNRKNDNFRFSVSPVFTEEEIIKLGSQQTDAALDITSRKYRNAFEFYRNIIAQVLNYKPDGEKKS